MATRVKLNDERQFVSLSGLFDTGGGAALRNAVERRVAEIRETNEKNPMRDDRDLKKDIVYRLGFLAGLNWVLDLPKAAQADIADRTKKGEWE